MAGWDDPPAVVLLYGNDDFHLRREEQRAKYASSVTGRVVEDVEAGAQVISDRKDEMLWSPQKVLLVVHDPENMGPEDIAQHAKGRDNSVAVLLIHKGDIGKGEFSKIIKGVPQKYRIRYNPPAKYKMVESASTFMVEELRGHGKEMSSQLAESMVNRIGTDLGVLSFEALKINAYMDALGEGPEVERHHVVRVLAQISNGDVDKFIDALERARVPMVVQQIALVREAMGDDGLFQFIGLLQYKATTWLQAADCIRQGLSESEGAARLSVSPWLYKNSYLPAARRWGLANIKNLIHNLSIAKAAVPRAHVSPWIELMTLLILSCREVPEAR